MRAGAEGKRPRGEEDISLPRGAHLRKGTGLGPNPAADRRRRDREERCSTPPANTAEPSKQPDDPDSTRTVEPFHPERGETSGEEQHFDTQRPDPAREGRMRERIHPTRHPNMLTEIAPALGFWPRAAATVRGGERWTVAGRFKSTHNDGGEERWSNEWEHEVCACARARACWLASVPH